MKNKENDILEELDNIDFDNLDDFDYDDYLNYIEEKDLIYRKILLYLAIPLIIMLFLIIALWPVKASALEVKNPDYHINNYYGYRLPVRVMNDNNYVDFAIVNKNSINTNVVYHNHLQFYNTYCPDWLGTCAYQGTQPINITNGAGDDYFYFNFHPGYETNDINQMLTDGNFIYLNGIYTFKFKVNVAVNEEHSSNLKNTNLGSYEYAYWSNTDRYLNNTMYSDNLPINFHTITMEYTYGYNPANNTLFPINPIDNNNNTYKYAFGNGLEVCQNSSTYQFCGQGSFTGVNAYGSGSTVPMPFIQGATALNQISYSVIIEQPYDIIFWSTDNTLTCGTNCWTDYDSDGANSEHWNEADSVDLVDKLINDVYFRDHGLGGIITNIYSKFSDILTNYNENTCYDFNLDIYGQNFNIPCGSSTWELIKNQHLDLYNFYGAIWICFVGFYVARKIFNYIISAFDIDDISGKDVLDL